MSSVSTTTVEGQLRRARGELEAALRAGADPRVEAMLAAYPSLAADPEAALELVYTEFVVRQEVGQHPTPDEWYARFPQWRDDLQQMFEVHDALCRSAARECGQTLNAPSHPTTVSDPPFGLRLPGYELLQEIGRGGMGVVYRARHLALNRVVAVKLILGGRFASTRQRERFRREAEAAARLDHPNIIRVYEVGEHDDHPYCAMEYVGGGSLADRQSAGPWPMDDAVRLVAELARATAHAHERGVVHRDLKPANVLLVGVGAKPGSEPADSALATDSSPLVPTPKVADFGLAKCLSDSHPTLTRAGDVIGTPTYMAPEQASGVNEVGPAADVWALGVILYELLTGHPPFRGDSATETLHQVRTAEPVPPRRLRAKLPRDLDTICLRCLQKEPTQRYQSAEALALDLERWRRGEAITARPVGLLEMVAKWARREPWIAGLAAGLAVVAMAGVAGVVWQWQRANRGWAEAVRAGRDESTARELSEVRLYASQVARAAAELAAGRIPAAERLLDDSKDRRPDLCGWEWDHLKRRCHTNLLALHGHNQPINWLAYSPDGKRIASCAGVWNGSDPAEVFVWDATTGKRLHVLRGPATNVHKVVWHPTRQELAAAGADGFVHRWNLEHPDQPLPPLKCDAHVFSVAYHPDGLQLAAASHDGRVQVWNLSTGKRSWGPWHTHNVYDVAYSPDGWYLASVCRDGTLCVREANTHRVVCERRLSGDARRVVFSPDGRLLATSTFSGDMTIWDVTAGFTRLSGRQLGANNGRGVIFRPDGLHLTAASRDADAHTWLVRGGTNVPTPGGSTGSAFALAYSPDARCLAVARDDQVIRVWDLTAPPDPRVVNWPEAWVTAVAASPDGRTMALAGGKNMGYNSGPKTIRLAPIAGGRHRELAGHLGWPAALAYRPDGDQLASADDTGNVILWNPAAATETRRFTAHDGPVHAIVYTPDGERLATAGSDRTVGLWNPTTGDELDRLDHPSAVLAIAISSDGRWLATGGADRLVRVWDIAGRTLRHTLTGHRAGVSAVAFRPGTAELVTADDAPGLRFWDADSGQELTAVLPDPPTWGSGPSDDPLPARPLGQAGASLGFSPDGRRLLFGVAGRPVQLWDAATRMQLLDLGMSNAQHRLSVTFADLGRRVVAASNTQVWVWDSAATPTAERMPATEWHANQAVADLRAGHWYGADFHATHVLAAEPYRVEWYARRGQARAALGRTAEADSDHRRALALSTLQSFGMPVLPDVSGDVWRVRAESCAARKDWVGATAAIRRAVAIEPDNSANWYLLATSRLAAGDTPGYLTACREMTQRFVTSPGVKASLTVYAAAPLIEGLDPDLWRRLARSATGRAAAAATYRSGQWREASRLFAAEQRRFHPRAWDMLFWAMAYKRMGATEEAASRLARAREWIAEADQVATNPTAGGITRWTDWKERVEVRALLAEAETLIDGHSGR